MTPQELQEMIEGAGLDVVRLDSLDDGLTALIVRDPDRDPLEYGHPRLGRVNQRMWFLLRALGEWERES